MSQHNIVLCLDANYAAEDTNAMADDRRVFAAVASLEKIHTLPRCFTEKYQHKGFKPRWMIYCFEPDGTLNGAIEIRASGGGMGRIRPAEVDTALVTEQMVSDVVQAAANWIPPVITSASFDSGVSRRKKVPKDLWKDPEVAEWYVTGQHYVYGVDLNRDEIVDGVPLVIVTPSNGNNPYAVKHGYYLLTKDRAMLRTFEGFRWEVVPDDYKQPTYYKDEMAEFFANLHKVDFTPRKLD